MENNNLYETIFKRKSTRKYDMTVLDQNILKDIKHFCDNVSTLSDIKHKIDFLEYKNVKNIIPIKAPHYICIYSEDKENYLMNTGYILQQISLYLSSIGLGNCWLGMAKPTKDVILKKDNLEFVIMLCFGKADEDIYRKSTDQFKRKPIKEISSIIGFDDLVVAVSLAPSAVNSQPWFLSKSGNLIIISRENLNFAKSLLYNRLNQIDIGIALCHLKLACENKNIKFEFLFSDCKVKDGFQYMSTLKLL